MQHQHQHVGGHLRNWREVLDGIVGQVFAEARIDDVARCVKQQRVAVGGSARDRGGPDVASRATAVLDDAGLPPMLVQLFPEDAPPSASAGPPAAKGTTSLTGFSG